MSKRIVRFSGACLISLVVSACGGTTEEANKGSAGSGGGGAAGGVAGAGGAGGASGSAGTGGGSAGAAGGSASDGGVSGSGGLSSETPLCTGNSDCKTGLCIVGRCITGFECDDAQVKCEALPPTCPTGQVPSVKGTCWGPCVVAVQCKTVTSCEACTAPNTTCVKQDHAGGDATVSSHCVSIPKDCESNPTCACMGKGACLLPYDTCMDLSGVKGFACTCPAC
jgi:hypothetical protein